MDATAERVDEAQRRARAQRADDLGDAIGWLLARSTNEDGALVRWTVADARRLCWARWLHGIGRLTDD